MFDTDHPEVRGAVERALAEDIGTGDITSELTVSATLQARGAFLAKEQGTLAGIELLPLVYATVGAAQVELLRTSGNAMQPGDILATVAGPARLLLTCERVSLNLLQRLSGVATAARRYVDAVAGTGAKILDTRKTTPGLRQLEKMAAVAGGATNHRLGLFDGVLIKNNHITAAGGVRAALENAKAFAGLIEIEVRTKAELEEALDCGAKQLLLDNLTPAEAADWIQYIDGRATVELSGGISLQTVRAYATLMPLDVALLSKLRPQTTFQYFPSIGSTMTEGARLVHEGASHGTAVIADEQTAGLGRLGRNWISEADVGIYCSILLRLALDPAQLPVISLAIGLAVADAVQKTAELFCDLRWPNDVLIGSRKVAGILPHLVDDCVVAGIGINVNNSNFEGELRTPATSLKMERHGREIHREQLLAQLLSSIDEYVALLGQAGIPAILDAFTKASSYVVSRRVVIEETGARVTTAGLDTNGFLLVRSDDGQVNRLAAGGVRAID